MLNSSKEIIVTSIKNVEEMILRFGDNMTIELKQKAEDTISKGYEELSKLISDDMYFNNFYLDSIYEKGDVNGIRDKTNQK